MTRSPMSLPFAISFAVTFDLALNAAAAVFGPEHLTIANPPIAQFGVLVAAGIVLHQIAAHSHQFWLWLRRQRRK